MKKNSIIILSLCALFLFYKYIAQLFPSLIGTELMHTYGYDAVMLAIMASSYYYSYTFMQILAGFIIDRFSIKIPMFSSIFIISIMLVVFTHTHQFYLLCMSRALMGIGAAFATVLYMKCAAEHTTAKTFGLISSFLATATMLGAAFGNAPIAIVFQRFGWHSGLNAIAFMGFMMAISVLIFQTSKKNSSIHVRTAIKLSNVKDVLTIKDNWLLLLYSGLTFSPVAILGGLWGAPFLMTKYSVNAANASFFLSIMFIGHALGSPIWALISAKLRDKKRLMHFANIMAFLTILAIIYGNFSSSVSLILFFMFGFSVGCFMLSFELCREINALCVMGLSVAFINSGEGIVGSIVEPYIGYLLDLHKIGPTFTTANFQVALFILPCCFILSSLTLLFIKKNHKVLYSPTYALQIR